MEYEAVWTDYPTTATGRTKEEAVANLQAKLSAWSASNYPEDAADPPLKICGKNEDLIECGPYIVGHVRGKDY